MLFGYRGNKTWRDMSEYVVHFTSRCDGKPPRDVLKAILSDGQLKPKTRFGTARGMVMLGESQLAVCFSEIPLDLLDRLVTRRSSCGLAFRKEFLVESGGGRVWYIENDGPVARAYGELEASKYQPWNADDPLWKLTPFIDQPGKYGGSRYEFQWEREWRVPGPDGLTFTPEDVAFLFMPEAAHAWAQATFGRTYAVPLIDPLWSDEQIQEAAAGIKL